MKDNSNEQQINFLPPEPPAYPWNGEEDLSLQGWRRAWVDGKEAYIEHYADLRRQSINPGPPSPHDGIRIGERITTDHTKSRYRATVNDCLRLGIAPCRITASSRGAI